MLLMAFAIFLAVLAALVMFFSGKFVISNLMGFVDGFFEGVFGKDSRWNTYWPFAAFALLNVVILIALQFG